jgi:hypothetical protein
LIWQIEGGAILVLEAELGRWFVGSRFHLRFGIGTLPFNQTQAKKASYQRQRLQHEHKIRGPQKGYNLLKFELS